MNSERSCAEGRGAFRRLLPAAIACLLLAGMTACGANRGAEKGEQPVEASPAAPEAEARNEENVAEAEDMKKLKLEIDGTELSVVWEDNESVAALTGLASEGPISVELSMYGGFEQVGSLGARLPRNDTQIKTQAGDIVLYAGDQIVLFYGSNAWAYTRLGHIELSAAELSELLGHGDVTLLLSVQ